MGEAVKHIVETFHIILATTSNLVGNRMNIGLLINVASNSVHRKRQHLCVQRLQDMDNHNIVSRAVDTYTTD